MFSEGRERLMANVRQRYSFPPDFEVELGVGPFLAATRPGSEPPSWCRTIENLLWQAAAVFAIYYGDSRHHLFHVLFYDTRICRIPFLLGFASLAIDAAIFTYLAVWLRHILKCEDKWELIAPTAIPTATLAGLTSLLLFSVALWPIWGVLSLPLLVSSGSNPSSSKTNKCHGATVYSLLRHSQVVCLPVSACADHAVDGVVCCDRASSPSSQTRGLPPRRLNCRNQSFLLNQFRKLSIPSQLYD